jgi:Na+/melibiose symporter-like transporter
VCSLILFGCWSRFKGDDALIPPSYLSNRTVYIGCMLIFLQGGATQSIPFFLPLWFQAMEGDGTRESAIHLLPSLVSMVIATISCGALVRKFRYIPPWAIVGGMLTSIGGGLLTTLTPDASMGKWIGYQVITSLGRGMAFQIVSSKHNMCFPVDNSNAYIYPFSQSQQYKNSYLPLTKLYP